MFKQFKIRKKRIAGGTNLARGDWLVERHSRCIFSTLRSMEAFYEKYKNDIKQFKSTVDLEFKLYTFTIIRELLYDFEGYNRETKSKNQNLMICQQQQKRTEEEIKTMVENNTI